MAQSLQEYITETAKSYEPAQQALQNQINALDSQLANTEQKINKQFAEQQSQLDKNRQTAQTNASMQAAGSGGSFGGTANIANRKYYENTFVPAVTQLQSNQQQALADARQASDTQRLNLESSLANLLTEASKYGISRYDDYNLLEKNQAFQHDESQLNRDWQSGENALDRNLTTTENQKSRDWQSGENALDRDLTRSENALNRDLTVSENQKDRDLTTSENQKSRDFSASESAKSRAASAANTASSLAAQNTFLAQAQKIIDEYASNQQNQTRSTNHESYYGGGGGGGGW